VRIWRLHGFQPHLSKTFKVSNDIRFEAAPLLVSNSRMQSTDAIDHRLTDLEIKASFSEDLLDQLNQVIIRQQQQIDALVREITQIRQQIPDVGSNVLSRAGDDLPPHY